jgi:flavodoxin
MKAHIVYDSAYGNTRTVAETIAEALKPLSAAAVPVADFDPRSLSANDLLVVGSPINGWRPTARVSELLAGLVDGRLKGVKAAAFDTRVRFFIHGDAAKKMTKLLKNAGAHIVSSPVPFYVSGTEGPLRQGETEKAAAWARTLVKALQEPAA